MNAARHVLATVLPLGTALLWMAPAVSQPADQDEAARQQLALLKAEHVQLIEGWRALGEDLGFKPLDMLALVRAWDEKRQLQEALRQEAGVLSTALDSVVSAPERATEAAQHYLQVRQETLAKMEAIDQELIARVGADKDPRKLTGLMILGVIDNGVRLLCPIHNGVIGGAPIGAEAAARVGGPASPTAPAAGAPQPGAQPARP